MEFFRERLAADPGSLGWYGWYALYREEAVVVGAAGYLGPPGPRVASDQRRSCDDSSGCDQQIHGVDVFSSALQVGQEAPIGLRKPIGRHGDLQAPEKVADALPFLLGALG